MFSFFSLFYCSGLWWYTWSIRPEEFCWNGLSRTIESACAALLGLNADPRTLCQKPGSPHESTVCNWDPAHMLSAILPKINLRLCIAYRTGQIDVVSAQMAIDAPKRTIPSDACLKDHWVLQQLIYYMLISVFDGLIPGLLCILCPTGSWAFLSFGYRPDHRQELSYRVHLNCFR